MNSCRLRVISCQVTRKVEAGYKPSQTNETLMLGIVCWMQLYIIYINIIELYQLHLVEQILLVDQSMPEELDKSILFDFHKQSLNLFCLLLFPQ
jgi:hypothetical protein